MTPAQLAALTDVQLEQLRIDAANEQSRRQNAKVIPNEIERLYQQYSGTGAPSWPELQTAIEALKKRRP